MLSKEARHTTCTEDLAAGLRVYAAGVCAAMAAVELLIGHRCWLRRGEFVDNFVTVQTAAGAAESGSVAVVDWVGAVAALDAGDLRCSGGEGRVLRIAAGLAAGVPVDLGEALGGLDASAIRLVAEAVLRANGRGHARVLVEDPPFPVGVRVVDTAGDVVRDGAGSGGCGVGR